MARRMSRSARIPRDHPHAGGVLRDFRIEDHFRAGVAKGVFPLSPKNLDTVGPMARNIPHLVEGMDLLKPGTTGGIHGGHGGKAERAKHSGRPAPYQRHGSAVDRPWTGHWQEAGCKVVSWVGMHASWERGDKNGQVIAMADGYTSDQHLLNEKGVTATTKAALLLGDMRRGQHGLRRGDCGERPSGRRRLRGCCAGWISSRCPP